MIGVEEHGVSGSHVPAVDVAAEGTLAEERGEDLPLRCGCQRPAEGLEVPRQPVRVLSLSVARVTARPGKVLDDLDSGLRALASPPGRLAVGSDAGKDSRKPVPPGVDELDVHGEDVPGLATLDPDRPDDRVVLRRPRRIQRIHMRIADELVDLRVIAVILDESGERILRLDLERLLLLDAKHRLLPSVECVLGHFAALDDLHCMFPPSEVLRRSPRVHCRALNRGGSPVLRKPV